MNYTLNYIKTEGGYVGYLSEIPGVCTQAETIEELRINIKDALAAMLEAMKIYEHVPFWENSIQENIEL
jgi:predicted RNase H-like HicB family nuclease